MCTVRDTIQSKALYICINTIQYIYSWSFPYRCWKYSSWSKIDAKAVWCVGCIQVRYRYVSHVQGGSRVELIPFHLSTLPPTRFLLPLLPSPLLLYPPLTARYLSKTSIPLSQSHPRQLILSRLLLFILLFTFLLILLFILLLILFTHILSTCPFIFFHCIIFLYHLIRLFTFHLSSSSYSSSNSSSFSSP